MNKPTYGNNVTTEEKVIYFEKDTEIENKNPIFAIIGEIDSNKWTRLFVYPLKTFEHDLAVYNPVLLAMVLKSIWPTSNGTEGNA